MFRAPCGRPYLHSGCRCCGGCRGRIDTAAAGSAARLRDEEPEHEERERGAGGEEQKRGREAESAGNVSRDTVAEGGTQAPGRAGKPLRQIVAARAPGEVGQYDEEERAE